MLVRRRGLSERSTGGDKMLYTAQDEQNFARGGVCKPHHCRLLGLMVHVDGKEWDIQAFRLCNDLGPCHGHGGYRGNFAWRTRHELIAVFLRDHTYVNLEWRHRRLEKADAMD